MSRARPLRHLAAPAAFAALFLILQTRLWAGRLRPIWDGDVQFAPFFSIVADHARAGRLLLWSPWTNGGAPLYADPQVGALAPHVVLLGAVTGGGLRGFIVYWLALWLFGGLGFLALARRLGAGPAPGVALALGYVAMGPYVGHAEHVSFLHSMSFVPWVLLAVDRALEEDSARRGALAGALWGLSALAGYPGFTLGTGLFVAGWSIAWVLGVEWRGGPSRGSWRMRARGALRVLAPMLGVGATVMAPGLFATLHDAAGYTYRSGPLPRAVAVSVNALEPAALWTLASGYIALARQSQWVYTDVSSVGLYVGACGALLAAVALLGRDRRRALTLAALAVAFLALALGRALPLRDWAYTLLPPSRYFRHASLFRYYACLALLLAAATAAPFPATASARWRRGAAAVIGTLGALAAWMLERAMAGARPTAYADHVARWGYARVALAVCVLAVIAYVLLARASRTWLRGAAAAILVAAAFLDAGAVLRTSLGLYAVHAGDRGDRWASLVHRREIPTHGLESERGPGGRDNFNLLTKERQLQNYITLRHTLFEAIAASDALGRMALGPLRLGFTPEAPLTAASPEAFRRWLGPVGAGQPVPLVAHTPEDMVGGGGARADHGSADPRGMTPLVPVEAVIEPGWMRYVVDVPRAGWLFIPERWGRCWSARIEGRPARLYGGNFAFMAVRAPAGRIELDLRYRPTTTLWLVALSWSTLLAVTIAMVARRRPRQPPGSGSPRA